MISGSVVVPFQKGPCGEGGRTRGFLLPSVVVVLVLLLIFATVTGTGIYIPGSGKQPTKPALHRSAGINFFWGYNFFHYKILYSTGSLAPTVFKGFKVVFHEVHK